MKKIILGLDLGSNSIGWALLEAENKNPVRVINAGSRIFNRAVEDKTPTPKNANRRDKRLGRRLLERRARRKRRMLNYLISLGLLPDDLKHHKQPEIILNKLGCPYELRSKALDQELEPYELGRVLLHLVQRRGFLSNRKTLLGDMADDPDVIKLLKDDGNSKKPETESEKEESPFKQDIAALREQIENANCRTLGEYLYKLDGCKRNRIRDGGNLRTDRQMYKDELELIFSRQEPYHTQLNDEVKQQLEHIIFYQRPLRLKADRIGKCSLEPDRNRARMGRLEVQRFRYLQDINNLKFLDVYQDKWRRLSADERKKLIALFETTSKPNFTKIKTVLGLDGKTEFNLDSGVKKLKGNITACEIRAVYPEWDKLAAAKQNDLVEDLLTINKKSVLKKRLVEFWGFNPETAVQLCLLEFEKGHSNLSVKAIKKLLPYLEQGQEYSDARISAGYDYEEKQVKPVERLGQPPEIPNPIVNRALHELRRLVNAIIAEYGKPDFIRIEMARDLEMNTRRYKRFIRQQKANTRANEDAEKAYQAVARQNPHLKLSKYPGRDDKIRYRLWLDQDKRCAYSVKSINQTALFSNEVEVDHIVPYSQSLDDSYMNKVVCLAKENSFKGQRTPIDAYGGNKDKWEQISAAVSSWDKKLYSKKQRFFMTEDKVQERDFAASQLNDTRYISRIALDYLRQLGSDITATKGFLVSWLRHQWGLNSIIGETAEKDRTDHRHHALDAIVIACIDRNFHKTLAGIAREVEEKNPEFKVKDLHVDKPWHGFRSEVSDVFDEIIVSHDPQLKISGALHEETGVGFIEGVGTVYRVNLNKDFKLSQLKKVLDTATRESLEQHLAMYDYDPKQAFAEGVKVYQKNGATLIKRVRIVQAKTNLTRLEKSKFGVKDKSGKVFKWLAYGNIHHVEIIKDNKSGRIKGEFVTMLEAKRRAMTGTKSAKRRGVKKEPVIKTSYDNGYEFIMALHKNDMVSVERDGQKLFYWVQKLDAGGNRVMLRYHTAATLQNKSEELLLSINDKLLHDLKLKLHKINVIGKIIDGKENN